MIDVTKRIGNVMRKQEFSDTDEHNNAARIVFGELKSAYINFKEEITTDIQYKILKKMKNDRMSSMKTYLDANRNDLANKEKSECNIINSLLQELEKEMPKQLSEDEIKNIIKSSIEGIEKPNIGIIMKAFKDIKNVDKALVSKIAKEFLK